MPTTTNTLPDGTHDDNTSRGYPLPHIDNPLEVDVTRIRSAVEAVDTDINNVHTRITGVVRDMDKTSSSADDQLRRWKLRNALGIDIFSV